MSTERGIRGGEGPAGRKGSPGAFGLAISSDASLPGLTPGATAGGRSADHLLVDAETLREHCAESALSALGRQGDGPLRIEYQQHASGGMLIETESFGDHLIADRGRAVLSAVDGADPALWRRYVIGQVLPLTASVQGLEIFHASAVSVGGGVVALAGPSGVGKSSLARALIDAGADFFTDDVLALDASASEVIAYPGPALMGIPLDQAESLDAEYVSGPPWAVDERKALAPVRGERRALPIRAFLLLAPQEEATPTSFEPCLPDRLMATTFDGISRTEERLRRLLRVAAMLAADDRALEVRYGCDSSPAAVARSLLDRLDA